MEAKIIELRSRRKNNLDILSEFQARYDLIDTAQIVRISYDRLAREPQKLEFLKEIKDLFLFRDKFVPENFFQGYIFVVEYLKDAKLSETEMDLFLFRRFYEGFLQKTTGLITYDKICKIIDYTDQKYPKTKEMKDFFRNLNDTAKLAIKEALRILIGGDPVSLPIFSGEAVEDYSRPVFTQEGSRHDSDGISDYGNDYVDHSHKRIQPPEIENFDGGYLVKNGTRRSMSAIEKFKMDPHIFESDQYLPKKHIPVPKQYSDYIKALKRRAETAYYRFTLDHEDFGFFTECEFDLADFIGSTFAHELATNPDVPTPFGYEKIYNTYEFESYVVDFTVTQRVGNESVVVGLPVRNVIPATKQLFKIDGGGPKCSPLDIVETLMSDPNLISHWQDSNPEFNLFLNFTISTYLQKLKESVTGTRDKKWKKSPGLSSSAFKEDEVSRNDNFYFNNSFLIGIGTLEGSITTNIIELPQINGWQNPNIVQKINFDLSQFEFEMLPVGLRIAASETIDLIWTIHRFVPDKNYVVQLAVETKQEALANMPPKGTVFSKRDVKKSMGPIRALIKSECIKKYDDYMIHMLHAYGSSQLLQRSNNFSKDSRSAGYVFHYNYWTVMATSVQTNGGQSYLTFYTLIHWATDYANYRRSSHRPGGGDGKAMRAIGHQSDTSARIRLLEDNNAYMTAAINELHRLPKLNVPRFDEHGGPWFIPGILNPSSGSNNYGSVFFNGVDTTLHKQMMDEKRRQFESIVMSEFYTNLLYDAEHNCRGNLNVAIANYIKKSTVKDKLIPSFPGLMGTFLRFHASEPARKRWSKLFTDFFDENAEIAPSWRQGWSVYGGEPPELVQYMKLHAEEKSRRKMYQARGGGGGERHYSRGGFRGGARGGYRGGNNARGQRGGYNGGNRGGRESGGIPASDYVWDMKNSEGVPPPRQVAVTDLPDGIEHKRSQYADIFDNHFSGEPATRGTRGRGRGRGRSAAYNTYQVNPDNYSAYRPKPGTSESYNTYVKDLEKLSAYRPKPGTGSEVEDLRRTVNRLALENMSLHQMSSS